MQALLDWAEEELCYFDCEEDPDAKAARQTYLVQKWIRFYYTLRRIVFRRQLWASLGQWLHAIKRRGKGRDHHLLK